MFGYRIGDPEGDLARDDRDNAGESPKCVVIDQAFSWGGDHLLRTPWSKTIIYEVHVKGFTARHPDVPDHLRGTYAGLSTPAVIEYLQGLGVTAVELLPVHHAVQDKHLTDQGLTNYWGYNTIGFFAPDMRYALSPVRGRHVREFKTMVKTLHSAGIEVILDVVYNHTAEGNHLGPTLSFRGIDNAAYYRLVADDPRYYMDYTGCGNSLNVRHPRTLQLIMDSLRYWVLDMHVDGFRFDLASTLARELHEVDRLSAFFDIIHQDPVLSQVKLIAEPWDLGAGGYQVGNFPVGWAEWNGKYRDAIRRYCKGDGGQVAELAYRLSGSSDLYEMSGRRPFASINFITAHDGFSLQDLVSYNEKHNEANGENNQDGHNDNLSWNCGAEGPTEDQDVLELRRRQKRNMLATLLLSQGVPMLCGGDEIGRTQLGNNNAYCQDNEISWHDWDLSRENRTLLAFVRRLIALRQDHPVFRRRRFFQGRRIHGSDIKDIVWLHSDGKEMDEADWNSGALEGHRPRPRRRRHRRKRLAGQCHCPTKHSSCSSTPTMNLFHLSCLHARRSTSWVLRLDTCDPTFSSVERYIQGRRAIHHRSPLHGDPLPGIRPRRVIPAHAGRPSPIHDIASSSTVCTGRATSRAECARSASSC
jgi:isoamylase